VKQAELVSFWVGEHVEGLVAALSDVSSGSAEAEQSLDFGVSGGRAEVDVAAQLVEFRRRQSAATSSAHRQTAG
jgi:hypothetical protein